MKSPTTNELAFKIGCSVRHTRRLIAINDPRVLVACAQITESVQFAEEKSRDSDFQQAVFAVGVAHSKATAVTWRGDLSPKWERRRNQLDLISEVLRQIEKDRTTPTE